MRMLRKRSNFAARTLFQKAVNSSFETTGSAMKRALAKISIRKHRRLGRELLVLRMCRHFAGSSDLAQHLQGQVEPERRECPLPELARGLSLPDEAPVLRGDRARVHPLREMVDRAAGDRIAFAYRP